MSNKQELVKRIIAGHLMSRLDQQDAYCQYQNTYDAKIPDNLIIFYSYYQYEDYSGYGHLVGYDTETDEFFYNSGSHCSCYGLEDQWSPEEYTYEQLVAYIKRVVNENDDDHSKELLALLTEDNE